MLRISVLHRPMESAENTKKRKKEKKKKKKKTASVLCTASGFTDICYMWCG
jgi:hypothetical protein